jgi:diguanylate cyclase (GGDEF)-like protein
MASKARAFAGVAYPLLVFLVAGAVLVRAWAMGEFTLSFPSDVPLAALIVAFAVFIIVLGFPLTPSVHLSLDRITQVGLVLAYGPADAALLNGLASLCFPLLVGRGRPLGSRLQGAVHNAGVFALIIYASGTVYRSVGGMTPLAVLDWTSVLQVAVLAVTVQVFNNIAIRAKHLMQGLDWRSGIGWYAEGVEVASCGVALLSALIYHTMAVSVFLLYLTFLIVVILLARAMSTSVAKSKQQALVLRELADSLEEHRERLEERVLERTHEIALQRQELAILNERKDELLAALERQTREDPLTGLFNRRYLNEFLEREVARFIRTSSPLCVAMVDIDHFKHVNDHYSHLIGDATLKAIAVVMQQSVRTVDMIARYGGEEILVCLPDTPIVDARLVCERIRAAIEAHDWASLAPGLAITASIGLSESTGPDVAELLSRSDARLYEAKRGGRNRVCG